MAALAMPGWDGWLVLGCREFLCVKMQAPPRRSQGGARTVCGFAGFVDTILKPVTLDVYGGLEALGAVRSTAGKGHNGP